MSETQSQSKRSFKAILIGVGALLIIILIVALITKGQTTITKTNNQDDEPTVTSLSCTAGSIDNGAFDATDAESANYAIDVIFYDNKLNDLTYSFTGKYPDTDTAKAAVARMHGELNLKLYSYGLDTDQFSSTNFNAAEDEARLRIHADRQDITIDSAAILMIDVDKESADQHIPDTLEELKANYSRHSFICKQKV